MGAWKQMLAVVGLWVATLSVGAQPLPPVPVPVPVEAYFKPASLRSAQLSPSGRWLAMLSLGDQGRVGFLMLDLDGRQGSVFIASGEKDDVVWFRWVNEDWLVFSVNDPNDRSTLGLGAGLMSLSRDGRSSRMLIAREWDAGDPIRRRKALEPNHRYVGPGAPGSNEVIVAAWEWNVRNEYTHSTLKALDVATGALRTLLEKAPRADSWWLDGQGRARIASYSEAGQTTLYWADGKTGTWREINRAPSHELPFWPAYVDGDDTLVVAVYTGDGHLELRRFDFESLRPGTTTLLSTPGFDGPVSPVYDRASGAVLGLGLEVDTATSVWFAPALRELQARADARFPGRVNLISCRPCDKPKALLVRSYSDADPGFLALYRPQEDKWQLVGPARPDIDPARMAAQEFHRTRARDGMDLPLWVTRSAALAAGPQPAVVLVHGGPFVRGTHWGWDAEAQFLASRGYVVIEPEFRGSEGYGLVHTRAGFKQWGQAMQDDLTDALRYAVAQRWVDPARVCIMGSSYGGYATLMGLVKDPELYRCGVAHAAVSDPRHMFDFHWNDISSEAKTYSLPITLGDRVADDAVLAAHAPLLHADRIKAPVLLVHGGADRRVPIQNGELMRDALLKLGKPVEWVVYPNEGHGFQHLESKLDFYRRVEAFLARHLKPAGP